MEDHNVFVSSYFLFLFFKFVPNLTIFSYLATLLHSCILAVLGNTAVRLPTIERRRKKRKGKITYNC